MEGQLFVLHFVVAVRVQVPSQAAAIKDYKQETARVTEIFSRIVKKSGDFEKIFIFCLRTLYRLIVEMSEYWCHCCRCDWLSIVSIYLTIKQCDL